MSETNLSGMNQLELKSLSELSGLEFIVKDYQRGYRWTSEEVQQMLDDFEEFVRRTDKKPGEFYCLQPIVVRESNENRYEVIDGQQRLTTINLILQFLSDKINILYPSFKLFKIEYTTRPGSKEFLSNIKTPDTDSGEYIDYHFMAQAYGTIVNWFKTADDSIQNKIMMSLLGHEPTTNEQGQTIDLAKNIRVIWYEIANDEKASSVDIFTRLNIGKIPLTDAELVKALFLNSKNFSGHDCELMKIHLSNEWNQIEQSLQNDNFWYFLIRSNNTLTYTSRIEFIFDIISGRSSKSKKYHTFNFFQRLIESDGALKTWLEVKRGFQLLNEWHADRELYHIIGYLLEQGTKISDLISKWGELSKSRFRGSYLHGLVKDTIEHIEISELSYQDDKADIKKILLLFNILTILQKDNSDMRFLFDRFKTEKWDIEHVCSQTDFTLEKAGIVQWCDSIIEYYLGENNPGNANESINSLNAENALKKDLKAVVALRECEKADKEEARRLFNEFMKRFNEDKIDDRDSIANLTLLDYATNRSYGNAFFPIKRKRIIDNDKTGVFVPIATKNMFLKYYSSKVDNMMEWTNKDGEDYLKEICGLINNYVNL